MNDKEIIRIAKTAIDKKWDFDTLYYGDDLNGKEQFAESVWKYVVECEEIGTIAFNEKYK